MAEEFAVIAMVFVVGAIIAPMIIFASRYKKVPPNKAMVVYGRRMPSGRGYRVISGGGKFIMPIVESYEFLDLEVWSLMFDLKDVRIDPGIPDGHSPRMAIEATALLKISSSNEGLMVAAEHLLRKTKEEIEHISRKIIEGHIRTALRNLPAETIDNGRDMVASKIQVRAEQDLINVGLEVRAFTMNRVDLRG